MFTLESDAVGSFPLSSEGVFLYHKNAGKVLTPSSWDGKMGTFVMEESGSNVIKLRRNDDDDECQLLS